MTDVPPGGPRPAPATEAYATEAPATRAPVVFAPVAPVSRWRRHGLPLLVMLGWFAAFTALYGIVQAGVLVTDAVHALRPLVVPAAVVGAAGFAVVYALGARWIDRRRPDELALAPAARETGLGLVVGAAAFCAALGLLVAAGLYTVAGGGGITRTGTALAVAVISGVCEEVIFRGILFRRLSVPLGTYGALGVSSVFFGLVHLANPGASLAGAAAIALEAGVMLGLAYVVTGRLWLPIGIHAAWNYVQGGVFGVAVSGNDVGGSVWRSTPVAGRDALTGGAFGVEASPAALVACLVVSAVLLVVVRRRGLVVRPAWRRPAGPAGRGIRR